jgi:hypothetical protein
MKNEEFDKYLQEKCKVYWAEKNYIAGEIAQGKKFFEAGQVSGQRQGMERAAEIAEEHKGYAQGFSEFSPH